MVADVACQMASAAADMVADADTVVAAVAELPLVELPLAAVRMAAVATETVEASAVAAAATNNKKNLSLIHISEPTRPY